MQASKSRFLLISDDKQWQEALPGALESIGDVEIAFDEDSGLEQIRHAIKTHQPYAVMIVDLYATTDMRRLIAQILEEQCNAGVVVASAAPTWRRAKEAFEAGAIDFINKTLNKEDLLGIFRNVLMKIPLACAEEEGGVDHEQR